MVPCADGFRAFPSSHPGYQLHLAFPRIVEQLGRIVEQLGLRQGFLPGAMSEPRLEASFPPSEAMRSTTPPRGAAEQIRDACQPPPGPAPTFYA